MKRKQRERASSTSKDEATAARLTGGGPMGLVRLRAIEHGVEENDLTSMNGLGEILPLLGRLKEGQDDLAMQALHTLRRVFLVLIKRGDVQRPAKQQQRGTGGAGQGQEQQQQQQQAPLFVTISLVRQNGVPQFFQCSLH